MPDAVASFLQQSLPWAEDQVVFYAPGRRYILRMTWQVFIGHWRRFTILDESWVFGLGRFEYALFADSGGLSVGDMRLSEPHLNP